jgi:glycolate dehydrogenase FAD-binding subunit
MSTAAISTENLFRSLLGGDAVRSSTPGDAICGVQPKLVLEPANELQLASALRIANDAGLAVIPRGGGTKLSWGNPPSRADFVLSTKRLDKILEHVWADMTVSVEAGCAVGALQSALAQHGQRLAIDVLSPKSATIGGILSTNDSGALRLRFGSLRDLIIGSTIALPDGTLASSGGKVVKNVAGYDMQKLVTGAFGTLGVITRAVFRLHPLPAEASTISCLARDAAESQRILLAIQDSKLAHSALQARFIEGAQPQVDVLFEATAAGIAAQIATLKSLVGVQTIESDPPVWRARQELFQVARDEAASSAIAKLSFLPTQLASVAEAISRVATANQLRATFVAQAFGIATLLLRGAPQNLYAALQSLRAEHERSAGSLVIQHRPDVMPPLDPWGTAPDSIDLMRSVKRQLDPKSTLNPGRFLAGI